MAVRKNDHWHFTISKTVKWIAGPFQRKGQGHKAALCSESSEVPFRVHSGNLHYRWPLTAHWHQPQKSNHWSWNDGTSFFLPSPSINFGSCHEYTPSLLSPKSEFVEAGSAWMSASGLSTLITGNVYQVGFFLPRTLRPRPWLSVAGFFRQLIIGNLNISKRCCTM